MNNVKKAELEDYLDCKNIMMEIHDFHVENRPLVFRKNNDILSFEEYKTMIDDNFLFLEKTKNQTIGLVYFKIVSLEKSSLMLGKKVLSIEILGFDIRNVRMEISIKQIN